MLKKVLIAEDDKITLKTIAKIVEEQGFIPILCSDGQRAWQVLEDNSDISLLITDYVMPTLSGADLVRLTRCNYSEEQLPIIVVSGLVKTKEINSTLKLGVRYFLPKPIERKFLERYIHVCINGQDLEIN